MPELFQDYWEAVARLHDAAKELDQAVAGLAAQAQTLTKWRETSPSTLDLSGWPSADRLHGLLTNYWEARGLLSKLYKRFPADQQRALQSPDAIDASRK